MTDEQSGLPADILNADGTHQRADVDDEHRRLHVERGRRRAARHHPQARARRAAVEDARRRSSAWSATGHRPVLQLVRPPDGREAHVWPPTGAPLDPILSSVDNGWLAVGLKIVENSVPDRCTGAPARSMTRWTSASTTVPDANRVLLPLSRPTTGDGAVLLRHRRQRVAGSSTTSASAAGSCRRRRTTGAGARSRTRATGPGRRPSRSASTRTYFGVDVFEGAYAYAGIKRRRRAGAAACSRR